MDELAILEFWHERAAILEFDAGLSRHTAEFSARHQTSVHFGFQCFEIIHAERKRLEVVRQLAALRGVTTGRKPASVRLHSHS